MATAPPPARFTTVRSIQVLRGFAVCAVAFAHSIGPAGMLAMNQGTHLAAAVDLFFLISGYVMVAIPKRSTFLYDRFWRVYPLWLIAVTPWILIYRPDWPTLATSLLLWPAWGKMIIPVLGVGWTLCFDVVFYVAVAMSMRTGLKPVLALYGVLLICGVLSRAPVFDFLGNPMFIECLMGAALTKLPRDRRLGLPLVIAAIFLMAIAPGWVAYPDLAMRSPASAWRVLYFGVPAALALYGCLCLEKSFHSRFWAVPVLLGNASYSIYLIHPAFTVGLSQPWPIELGLSIVAGLVMWRFLEEPLRKMKPRWKPKALVPAE
jgi:exopolysaccharide production protein ExoZ